MGKTEGKAKRLTFGWRDGIVLVAVLAVTAGVFVWSWFTLNADSGTTLFASAYYQNRLISSSLLVSNGNEDMEYTVSFRRKLKEGEQYSEPASGTKTVTLSVSDLNAVRDFSSYKGTYFIVDGKNEPSYSYFSGLYGTQVDLTVKDGAIQVTKEDSPTHDCAYQGKVDMVHLPVVCLPNSIRFELYAYDENGGGPDA